jgi:hypothetical protein
VGIGRGDKKIVMEYFIGQAKKSRPELKCVKRYLVLVESQTVRSKEKLEAAMKTGEYYHIMVPSVNAGVTAGIERGEFCGEHDHIES